MALAVLALTLVLSPRAPQVAPPPAEADRAALARWAAGALGAVGFPVDLEGVAVETVRLGRRAERERFAELWLGWTLDGLPPGYVEAREVLAPVLSRAERETRALWRERGEPAPTWIEGAAPAWQLGMLALARPDERRIYFLDHEDGPWILEGEFEPWHVAVHEVAHVAQFAHGLGAVDATLERRSIRQMLFEGEAELAMLAVHSALAGAPLAERDAGWIRAELARLYARPPGDPYEAGAVFLLPALQQGGWPAVRALCLAPPPSSERILHPGTVDEPTAVLLPPWPADLGAALLVHEDVWGEAGIAALLQELGAEEAVHAGWDGDRMRVAVFASGVRAATWRTVWDREEDAERFALRMQGEMLGRFARAPRVVDWAWSSDPELEPRLLEGLAAAPQPGPAD